MMSRAAAALMLLLAATAPQAAPGSSVPAEPNFRVVYDFYFAGLRVAKIVVAAQFEGDGYQATGRFQTVGVVDLFADLEVRSETVGKLGSGGLVPLHYRSRSEQRLVEVTFSDNGPSAVSAEPPYRQKPWSIEPGDQHGTTDPLSAVLSAVLPGSVEAACDRRVEAYDGRNRFAFEIGAPRPEDGRIRCDATFIRLGGYKPKTMERDARRSFSLWLAERQLGRYQVVELTAPIDFGVANLLIND